MNERRSDVHAIAIAAMLTALCAITSTLASYFVIGSLLSLFLIPFFSSVASYKIEGRWLPLYALASICLCVLFSFHDMSSALFTAVPGVLGGTLYGYLRKKNVPVGIPIVIGSYLYLACIYLSIPLLEVLSGRNLIEDALFLFQLQESRIARELVPLLLYLFSLSSIGLSSLLIEGISPRFLQKSEKRRNFCKVYPYLSFLFSSLCLLTGYFLPSLSYIFLASSLFLLVFAYPSFKGKKPYIYLVHFLFLLIGLFLFAFLYPYMGEGIKGGTLLAFLPLFASLHFLFLQIPYPNLIHRT